MQKVLVILGQTATGKSDFAVKLAKKIDGEIVSADPRQVYKGLDIGSGKITKKEMQGIPHHLLDVASLKNKFNVSLYKDLAETKIKEIFAQGKTPIICGGTGFYIDSLVNGVVFPEVPPNNKLRKELEKKDLASLFKILKKLDPKRAKTIDVKNKVRLVRAIEIATTLGKVPKITQGSPVYKFIKIGLYLPKELLKAKIKQRLLKRLKTGMLREAKNLNKNGLSWKKMEALGLEYKFMALHLQNKLNKAEMVEKLNLEIYRYAKRQMTWFKRDKGIKWIDASQNNLLVKQKRELVRQLEKK